MADDVRYKSMGHSGAYEKEMDYVPEGDKPEDHIAAITKHLAEGRKALQSAHSYMDDIESRLSQMSGGAPIPRARPGDAPSGGNNGR